jgi:hypothetical protein
VGEVRQEGEAQVHSHQSKMLSGHSLKSFMTPYADFFVDQTVCTREVEVMMIAKYMTWNTSDSATVAWCTAKAGTVEYLQHRQSERAENCILKVTGHTKHSTVELQAA